MATSSRNRYLQRAKKSAGRYTLMPENPSRHLLAGSWLNRSRVALSSGSGSSCSPFGSPHPSKRSRLQYQQRQSIRSGRRSWREGDLRRVKVGVWKLTEQCHGLVVHLKMGQGAVVDGRPAPCRCALHSDIPERARAELVVVS